jgi:hypothetical protein
VSCVYVLERMLTPRHLIENSVNVVHYMVRSLVPVGINGSSVMVQIPPNDGPRVQDFCRETGHRFQTEAQLKSFLRARTAADVAEFRASILRTQVSATRRGRVLAS